LNGGGDYATVYGITEKGAAGQATRITAATGGVFFADVPPENIVKAIMDGLAAIKTMSGGRLKLTPALQLYLIQ